MHTTTSTREVRTTLPARQRRRHSRAAEMERCRCRPLSGLHLQNQIKQIQLTDTELTPTSSQIQRQLRRHLKLFLPRSAPISVLVLHISQLGTPQLTSKALHIPQRPRYHASASQVEQIVLQMRRTLRCSDKFIIQDSSGVALILPDVDHQGVQIILERVYQSIGLLQAQTIIPPLKQETEITIGVGSYPNPSTSLERLLYYTGLTGRQITLRPVIHPQDWQWEAPNMPEMNRSTPINAQPSTNKTIPFMQLPSRLPAHLTYLLPYELARKLLCAPVGSEQNNLTVAMADPTDAQAIQLLGKKTTMNIFPVACDPTGLNKLLTLGW